MRIIEEVKLDFDDVLIKPKRTNAVSRNTVELVRHFKFYNSTREWFGIPIIVANMDVTGTVAMAKAMAKQYGVTCLHKYLSVECMLGLFHQIPLQHFFVTTGIDDTTKLFELFYQLKEDGEEMYPNVCIDVANGYSQTFTETIKRVRDKIGEVPIIMAGNVCTPEMVEHIITSGADIVKVGIGPGKVCTTRKVTGIGYPQLSAIMECADAAHGLMRKRGHLGLICADGGCRTSGDFAKAFAGNADFVMAGGYFAGCNECDGEWTYEKVSPGNHYFYQAIKKHPKLQYDSMALEEYVKAHFLKKNKLKFYGMSSEKAQKKHGLGLKDYRASEGTCIEVPYKGKLHDVMQEITGGLRSTCTYVGAVSLKDLPKCTTFVKVNRVHL